MKMIMILLWAMNGMFGIEVCRNNCILEEEGYGNMFFHSVQLHIFNDDDLAIDDYQRKCTERQGLFLNPAFQCIIQLSCMA